MRRFFADYYGKNKAFHSKTSRVLSFVHSVFPYLNIIANIAEKGNCLNAKKTIIFSFLQIPFRRLLFLFFSVIL